VTPPERSSAPIESVAAAAVELHCLRDGLRILALRALRDADAAEEAVQETMARAVQALRDGRLSDPAKLGAYVAGIARHVFSHARRDQKATVSLEVMPPETGVAAGPDPLEALITAAETDRLRRAFGALSGEDQRLLRLCFYENRSPSEVAAALGEPAERVRKRKSRALDRLRRAFLGEEPGHGVGNSGTTGQEAPGGKKEREPV
jgi:RNA polymerase sigma factor (sigma-70 family)